MIFLRLLNKIMKILYLTTTNRCTLSCRYCFYSNGLEKSLSDINIEKFLKKIKSLSKYFDEVVFTGGEALLLKEIFLLATEFKKNGVKTRIITNGTLLTPDVCKKIILAFDEVACSLDSLDPRQNDLTRGKFYIVKEGLNNLLKVRPKNLEIEILQTITTINYNSIREMMKFCEEKKLKLWLAPVDLDCDKSFSLKKLTEIQMSKFKTNFKKWIEFRAGDDRKEQDALNSFLNNIENLIKDKPIRVPCKMGTENFMINPDGNMYACFYRKDLFFGNIYKDKLSKIMEKNSGRGVLRECVNLGCLCLTDF